MCNEKNKEAHVKKLLVEFLKSEDAASAVEYGLLAALVAVVIIVAVTNVGNKLNTVFRKVANSL
ncbi:MAG: Flp family type IVb pilin [Candidatus Puniceispirillum sp.]|nr:Flp family type IVb pilin [Candidatus Puniceispirillum sp.]